MWKDLHDAQMRANYTVVRYRGKPVYITSIEERGDELVAEYRHLRTGSTGSARLSCPSWDWSPVPTGFVNYNGTAYFVERRPVRKYKHGLSKDNCKVTPGNRHAYDMFRSKAFGKTVARDYPAFEECMNNLVKGQSMAFHPEFALAREQIGPVWLLYRTNRVGWFEKDGVVLDDQWLFLKEVAQEAGI